jgi:uroporphyrinogen decarboxylase
MVLPAIYHSDGNIFPLIEDIIGLGVKGVGNIEPSAIDIEQLKRDFGERITIIGNIDLNYTLTKGIPEETEEEVRRRIKILGRGGPLHLGQCQLPSPLCQSS